MNTHPPALVVSLHDVHPGSFARIRSQRKTLSAMGVARCSLLVVPWWHGGDRVGDDPELCAWLRRRVQEGDEVVLHGWRHDCEGQPAGSGDWFWRHFYTAGESEFLTLARDEAAARIESGREALRAAGLSPSGFIAPAWLLGLPAREVLRRSGFVYTVGVDEVDLLQPSIGGVPGRSLCWSVRSWWRRALSLPWNRFLLRRRLQRAAGEPDGLVRISLHPDDFHHSWIRAQILESVGRALAAGCRPETYAVVAERARFGRNEAEDQRTPDSRKL